MADNTVLIEKINGLKVELDAMNEEINKLMAQREELETMIEEGVNVLLSSEGGRAGSKVVRVMTR